ncbi:MAG: GNAT family N-acetyltransferase [Rhodospirillales bacterium]
MTPQPKTDVVATFRIATADDVPRLHDLYRQLIPDADPDETLMVKALETLFARDDAVYIVMAEVDGLPIATLQLIVYENLIRVPFKKAIIDSVVVDEPYRHQGHGTALVEWSLDHLTSLNCSIVTVSTAFHRDVAPKLYEKTGFTRFGTTFSVDLRKRAGKA